MRADKFGCLDCGSVFDFLCSLDKDADDAVVVCPRCDSRLVESLVTTCQAVPYVPEWSEQSPGSSRLHR